MNSIQVVRGILLLLAFSVFPLHADISQDTRPNILIILADDMGYTDIGPFGGEISTPSLDQLASQGIRLSNFHVLPTCAPTRSVLLTGTDNHRAGLGSQVLTAQQRGRLGYEGYLSPNAPTLAEVLQGSGYRTYLSGKWHLGLEEGQRPYDRGFQETFSLLSGAASHFADATGISPLEPAVYSRNGQLIEALPDDFYSSRGYTDALLDWLERDQKSSAPFFAYLSFTAPHDPLHAPQAVINKYEGVYDEGYEVLRQRRHTAALAKGVISEQLKLGEWPGIIKPWHSLPEELKEQRRRDMQTYAAMIDYMDEQIGRVFQWLRDRDQFDNTLVLFFSDNGANAFPATMYPGHTAEYHAQYDNSLANRGLRGSFTEMGAGWAAATSAGLRLFKAFSSEGGIRVPAILKPVGGVDAKLNNSFTHVQDIMPTLLELTKASHPASVSQQLKNMTGRSQLPLFQGDASHWREAPGIGYELHGNRAFFDGPWKILRMPIPMGHGEWELFNLDEDPAESNDLADEHPEILARLVAQHEAYESETGVIYGLFGPPAKVARLLPVIQSALVGLSLLCFIWGVRSQQRFATILALVHLTGAILFIVGDSHWGTMLLWAASITGLGYSLKQKHWAAAALPVCTLIFLLGLAYLKSGRALNIMMG